MKTQTKSGKVQTRLGCFKYSLKMKKDKYQLETLILFLPKATLSKLNNQSDLKKDVLFALGFYSSPSTVVRFNHRQA